MLAERRDTGNRGSARIKVVHDSFSVGQLKWRKWAGARAAALIDFRTATLSLAPVRLSAAKLLVLGVVLWFIGIVGPSKTRTRDEAVFVTHGLLIGSQESGCWAPVRDGSCGDDHADGRSQFDTVRSEQGNGRPRDPFPVASRFPVVMWVINEPELEVSRFLLKKLNCRIVFAIFIGNESVNRNRYEVLIVQSTVRVRLFELLVSAWATVTLYRQIAMMNIHDNGVCGSKAGGQQRSTN